MKTEPDGSVGGARALLDRIGHAAVALDRAGVVIALNTRAERILDRPAADLVGSPLLGRRAPSAQAQPFRPPRVRSSTEHTLWIDRGDGEQHLMRLDVRRDGGIPGGGFIALIDEASSVERARSANAFEREILGAIAAGSDPPEVFARAGRALLDLLGVPVVFYAADRSLQALSLVATDAVEPRIAAALGGRMAIGADGPPCAQAVLQKRPVIVRDLGSAGTVEAPARERLIAAGARACWSYPVLASRGDVLGSMVAFPPISGGPSADDEQLLTKAAELAALVLERVRTDEDRFALEHRYRTLATMSSDFAYCFEIDGDGAPRLAWVTEAFQRITGYQADEWVRAGAWRGIIHPDDLLAFEQRLPRLMDGEEVSGEYRILTKDGEVRWISLRTRPVRDPASGRITSIIGSAHDFTARKEAEDAKTMFLATASHELKTPLTVIQGFAQMLGTEQADQVEDEAIGAIRRRSIQLNKIIDRILLSSRIETGRAAVSVKPVEPAPIVTELVEALAGATQRDIRFEANEVPAIEADPDAFTTVIDHLLDNAVKYSPDGGPITVRVHATDEHVSFEVRDHGVGMTEEQLARCFEKFWQAESTDVRRFGGTGIGLFIVRSLVEAMGGRVDVASTLGQGSTFRITMRRAVDPVPGSQPGEPSVIREFMRQLGIPARREP